MKSTNAPGDYDVYSVVGDRYTFLLTGAQTGGAYAVLDFFVPPGSGSPPHVHRREDEAFYVIDGEFEFIVAGEPIRVTAGGFLFAHRDIPHNFTNVGSTPGRMIVTITPAGLEEFFAEVGTRLQSREDAPIPPTPEDIARLIEATPKYGLEILNGF
ncbi:cupin domain-containing protein [Singulisphaera acidiphila]|uniref:Cupin domain-containing protein n=1 Tax=Singulisphaera acidiphila (strain ATCC BAA-1392 / DSM 18658 / VKM B-2454 / MOB10) TaxID=886293 RepID=L0D7J2_SINAD|nr:cupin domain-containing protein [Singulisphaera acidiphila]AGA24611.1 cupin domain-containing protein [Singulisphaera acidiphila DSM 18658]